MAVADPRRRTPLKARPQRPQRRCGCCARAGRARGIVALLGPAVRRRGRLRRPGQLRHELRRGGGFGYALAWAVVIANLMAMLVQYLSAKTGVATGRDLPQLCREHFGAAVSAGLWVQAELIAMATDLAEFVGAAIGLNLLFHVPLLAAGLITAVVAFGILALQQRGYRRFELAIAGLLGIVLLGFAYDLAEVGASPRGIAAGLVPGLASDRLLLVSGIIGATVMPHVVYLHSALTKSRVTCDGDAERRELLRFQRLDVVVALGAAGLVNLAMLFVAASVFHRTGGSAITLSRPRTPDSPGWSAGVPRWRSRSRCSPRGCPRRASAPTRARWSCRASSAAGSRCGPAARSPCCPRSWCSGSACRATDCLVISQVVLSFGIPFALVPLVLLTRRADVMGALVNRRPTTVAAAGIAAMIIALNVYLLWATFAG